MSKKVKVVLVFFGVTGLLDAVDYNAVVDQFALSLQKITTSSKSKPALPRKKVNFSEKLAQKKYGTSLQAVLKSTEGKALDAFLKSSDKHAQTLRESIESTRPDIMSIWEIFSKSAGYKKPDNIISKFDNDALIKISQAIASNDSDGNLKNFVEVVKILNKPTLDLQDQIKTKDFDKKWPFDTIKKIEEKDLLNELKKAIAAKDTTHLIKIFKQVDFLFGSLLEKEPELQNLVFMIKDQKIMQDLLKNSELQTIYQQSVKKGSPAYDFIVSAEKPLQEFLSNHPPLLQFLIVKDTHSADKFTNDVYKKIVQRLIDLPITKKDQLNSALEYIKSQLPTITSRATDSRSLAIQAMKQEFPFRDLSEEGKELETNRISFNNLLKNNAQAKSLFDRKELAPLRDRFIERVPLAKQLIDCKECLTIIGNLDKNGLETVATDVENGAWDLYDAQEMKKALETIQEW